MSSIKVSPFGAYLTSWKIKGREVLYQGSEIKRTGIPLLFPNFDFGPPLPNHGFGRISNWQVIKIDSDSCHLRLTENDISLEFRQIYPYEFILDLKINAINNQLNYMIEVKNTGIKDIPISPGLHPYWPIKHSQKSQIKIIDFPKFNPQITDWDNNPPNSLYDFDGNFMANFPDYQLIIKDISPKNIYFSHLQIWSQNTSFPDYNFVCFEPVTRAPNSINTNPILISSNKTEMFYLQFKVILP